MWGFESLSLQRPTFQAVQNLLDSTPSGAFNHAHVSATEHAPPLPAGPVADRWVLDHNRVQVGSGRQHYEKARRLLERWRHMDLGWVQTNAPAIRKGEKVCVSARSLVVWNQLPLEVAYARIEKPRLPLWQKLGFPVNRELTAGDLSAPPSAEHGGPSERFVFATSTTRGHQLMGEERFSIEWHLQDNSVWYEIYTISKPATLLATLTYPIVRFHQKHFARQSLRRMVHAVAESVEEPAAPVSK